MRQMSVCLTVPSERNANSFYGDENIGTVSLTEAGRFVLLRVKRCV
jgi:hypothetical protein